MEAMPITMITRAKNQRMQHNPIMQHWPGADPLLSLEFYLPFLSKSLFQLSVD